MLGYEFDHDLMKKYYALFGTLFNKIYITRRDGTQRVIVPLAYGPREKFLGRLESDPEAERDVAIQLPRMSFELVSLNSDRSRRGVSKLNRIVQPAVEAQNGRSIARRVFAPVPWNLNFQLNIMTKTLEDGNKILGQILPFFTPNLTLTAQLIEDMPNTVYDIPITLNSVQPTDTWEGDFKTRRALIWTLDFTLEAYFFGPVTNQGVIKKVFVNLYPSLTSNVVYDQITVQPGLTANGEPTTDINQTIPYQQIEEDDDWAYIVQIENLPDDE